jgi:(2R)-phospho-3-sulfolactate synthase (ComA)/glycosyl hydrolase family 65
VTNGKIIRGLVDDEPFDVRSGALGSHERLLDFRAGVLRRRADSVSAAGQQARVSSVRLVPLVHRAVATVLYEVVPVGAPARLVVQSELVANEQMPRSAADPRAAAQLGGVLRSEQFSHRDTSAVLVRVKRRSALRIAAAMDHLVAGPPGTETATESSGDLGRVTIMADVSRASGCGWSSSFAYGWSRRRSTPALRDQVAAALAEARRAGWEGLLADQRGYPDDFWERADVELEGDHTGGHWSGTRTWLRLLRRGSLDGPREPRAQHPRRAAHRLATERVQRAGLKAQPEVGIQLGAGGATTPAELEQQSTRDVGYAIDVARRCLDAGAYMIVIESEGITEEVTRWRTDVVATIARELGLEKVTFEAADPEVFGWYVKDYGTEVNLFVDHSQIVQLECLRRDIWGTKSLWGRVVTYPGG